MIDFLKFGSPAGGGASTFLGLTDTPSAYTGSGLDILRVNTGETAVEFINHQKSQYEGLSNQSLISSDFTELASFREADGIRAIPAGPGAGTFGALVPALTDHPGIWRLKTGTATTGRVFLISEPSSSWHVGVGGITRVGTWVKTGATLSTALQRYTLRNGIMSITLPNIILFGIGFEYDDSQNGGRWQAFTHDGTETSADTGITVVVDTWYKMEFEVNAAGTSVEYFIDDVSVATIATNIPSGTGFRLFYNTHIMKLIGTTDRDFFVDAYYVYQEITR